MGLNAGLIKAATQKPILHGPDGWSYDPNRKVAIAPDGQTAPFLGQGDPTDADLEEITRAWKDRRSYGSQDMKPRPETKKAPAKAKASPDNRTLIEKIVPKSPLSSLKLPDLATPEGKKIAAETSKRVQAEMAARPKPAGPDPWSKVRFTQQDWEDAQNYGLSFVRLKNGGKMPIHQAEREVLMKIGDKAAHTMTKTPGQVEQEQITKAGPSARFGTRNPNMERGANPGAWVPNAAAEITDALGHALFGAKRGWFQDDPELSASQREIVGTMQFFIPGLNVPALMQMGADVVGTLQKEGVVKGAGKIGAGILESMNPFAEGLTSTQRGLRAFNLIAAAGGATLAGLHAKPKIEMIVGDLKSKFGMSEVEAYQTLSFAKQVVPDAVIEAPVVKPKPSETLKVPEVAKAEAPKVEPTKLEGIDAEIAQVRAARQARLAATTKKGTKKRGAADITAEDLADAAKLTGLHIKKAGATFEQYAKDMVDDFGEAIKPHLQKLWSEAGGKAPDDAGPVTGVSMAARTQDAKRLDTPLPERLKGHTNEEAYNAALERQGKVDVDKLMTTLAKKKTAATQAQVADIAVKRGNLIAELEDLSKKLDEAPDDVTRALYHNAMEKIAAFDKALDVIKAESGRGLAAFKIGNRVEDMTFTEVAAEAKRRFDVDIDPEGDFATKFKNLENELKNANKRLKELEDMPAGADDFARTRRELEILKKKIASLRRQKAHALNSLAPQTVMARLNKAGREVQLFNLDARIVDFFANSVKAASYVVQNPVRSVMSSALFGKTVGRETWRIGAWQKTKQLFDNAPARWKQEASDTLKGVDMDTELKLGTNQGIITKATGVTDVPFRDVYYRMAVQDWVATHAKQNKVAALEMWDQITKGSKGPLTEAQVKEVQAMAHDWSLRNTFNNENIPSTVVQGMKDKPARFLEDQFPGRAGKEAADGWRFLIDSITRFSKVIGNVAAEKATYAYGLPAAAARLAMAKSSVGLLGKIPAQEARIIVDLASKGLTGIAMYKLGEASYDWIQQQGWIKGEIVSTAGGTKFVKWTLFPEMYGGLDATQLGGMLNPWLMGATRKMVEESGLTEDQKELLIKRSEIDAYLNQPLTSGVRDVLQNIGPEGSVGKAVGSFASRQIIPGVVSKFAERQDQVENDVELRKSKGFWDEFIKRIPKTGLNPETNRQMLPANEKSSSRRSGRQGRSREGR